MRFVLDTFNAFPPSVKSGVVCMIAGWIWYFFSMYQYIFPGELDERQIIAGVLTCTLVFTGKPWSRVFAILGNSMLILANLAIAFIKFFTPGGFHHGIAASVSIVLFGVSTVFLLQKSSAAHFKTDSEKKDGDADASGGSPGK